MRKQMIAGALSIVLALSGCGAAQKSETPEQPAESRITEDSLPEAEEPGQPITLTEEYWEATVGPGFYRIGTDIPLGVMDIIAVAGSGHITSSDGTLNLDMTAPEGGTESLTEGDILAKELMAAKAARERNEFPDLTSVDTLTDEEMQNLLDSISAAGETDYYPSVGFMQGVILTVTGAVKLRLVAENSDVSGMKKRSRIGGPVELGEGEYTAGKDFDPGTYVITVREGIGSASSGDGSMFVYLGYPPEDGINSERFMNYSCKDGDTIRIDGVKVEMQRMSG